MLCSHPQVVFAAERLQQLLVVPVTHLTQKGQQTRHKLSLTGQIKRKRESERNDNVSISFNFEVQVELSSGGPRINGATVVVPSVEKIVQ